MRAVARRNIHPDAGIRPGGGLRRYSGRDSCRRLRKDHRTRRTLETAAVDLDENIDRAGRLSGVVDIADGRRCRRRGRARPAALCASAAREENYCSEQYEPGCEKCEPGAPGCAPEACNTM